MQAEKWMVNGVWARGIAQAAAILHSAKYSYAELTGPRDRTHAMHYFLDDSKKAKPSNQANSAKTLAEYWVLGAHQQATKFARLKGDSRYERAFLNGVAHAVVTRSEKTVKATQPFGKPFCLNLNKNEHRDVAIAFQHAFDDGCAYGAKLFTFGEKYFPQAETVVVAKKSKATKAHPFVPEIPEYRAGV